MNRGHHMSNSEQKQPEKRHLMEVVPGESQLWDRLHWWESSLQARKTLADSGGLQEGKEDV